MPKAIILIADYGQDPTETTIPYINFRNAGLDVTFATETGTSPECDAKTLSGITRALFGASTSVVRKYELMAASWEWKHPQSWSAAGFTLDPFDLVFLPGGQDKHTRQLIDSFVVHQLLADYFPMTRRPSKKAIGAVCYGVKVLADTKRGDGKSVLHGCYTTTLPQAYENIAYWSTRLFMGDYMRVYGAGSSHVESWVREALAKPGDLKSSLLPSPFITEDKNFNYVSGRFQVDCELVSKRLVEIVV